MDEQVPAKQLDNQLSEVAPMKTIDMDKLREMNLPFDIQLHILKELLRLWATKMPKYGGGMNEETNIAILYFQNGWRLQPTEFRIQEDEHLSNILNLTALSKKFRHPPLKTFFFSHMIWRFKYKHICKLLSPPGYGWPTFPRQYMAKFRSLMLGGFHWDDFAVSFEKLCFAMIIEKENPFPSLKYLYIHFENIQTRLFNDTTYIRWLVTHCYLLVQKHPKLVISFSGYSSNFPYSCFSKEEYMHERLETWFEEGTVRDQGFGYSEDEAEAFADGTSELLSGLKNIEFPDIASGKFCRGKVPLEEARLGLPNGGTIQKKLPLEDGHWQMEVARQWQKVWAQGLEKSEKEGGYAWVPTSVLRL